ncbi:MAG TPA: hypothetical protein VD884_21770 [Ohtaekwangia sp.]|nr:hypothetical protein [Ohtaekwangia sp.]
MIKWRLIFFLGAITLSIQFATAQDYVESALMFSRTKIGGSARIQGLGGAQISLGGDYSSAFSNPAGLGMFNRSEVSLTPALTGFSTGSNFLGNKNDESLSRLQIPGFGIVFNVPGRQGGDYIGGSFAITLNRTNDFREDFTYFGANENSSIIDSFLSEADGFTTEQFEEGQYHYNTPTGLAYFNYLIGPTSTRDPDDGLDTEYFTDVQSNFQNILSPADQFEQVSRKGAMNQWSLSYGANFRDRYFVGGGIGIASLRYESRTRFYESYAEDNFFDNLMLEENVEITGSGINATLGAIVRPVDFLQVGISYTTPTYYTITDTYSASMNTTWKNFDYYGEELPGQDEVILNNESASTDIVTSEYNFTVPSRLRAGVTFISKIGFISTDLEFTNPSRGKYSSETPGVDYQPENEGIKSSYASTMNFRVGGEYRYKILRFRAGYGIEGNPYKSNLDIDDKITSISGGIGVRLKKFYIDFALIQRKGDSLYQPYTYWDGNDYVGPVVDLSRKLTSGLITIGFNY